MVQFRRVKIPGAIYFFTVTLQDRKSQILTKYIKLFYQALSYVKNRHPFIIHAMVVLPDHFHALWQLPENDDAYSMRLRQIKSLFTKKLIQHGLRLSKNKRGECQLWQRRFWEHTIRDDKDFLTHFNYIHYNPVKHRLVTEVSNWPHSSFHRHVKNGLLPKDWCSLDRAQRNPGN